MKINALVHFKGQCQEAFQFYAQALGGKVVSMMPYAGTPTEKHVPAEWRDKIQHATLQVGDNLLMGSDVPPQSQAQQPGGGFAMAVNVDRPEEAEKFFRALSEQGTVQMPLAKTFWSPAFGSLVDRYGISWMVNCTPASGEGA